MMASVNYEFMFFLSSHLMLLLVLVGGDEIKYQGECPPSFSCGYLGNISFPFTTTERQDCGLLPIPNCDGDPMKAKMIKYQNKGKWFEFVVAAVYPPQLHSGSTCTCVFRDINLYKMLQNKSCEAFKYNYTLPPTSRFVSFHIEHNTTLFMCNRTLHIKPPTYMHNYTKCSHYDLYYQPYSINDNASRSAFTACTDVPLPSKDFADASDPFTFVTADIQAEVHITKECAYCHVNQKGRCQVDSKGRFYCANGILKQTTWKHKHT